MLKTMFVTTALMFNMFALAGCSDDDIKIPLDGGPTCSTSVPTCCNYTTAPNRCCTSVANQCRPHDGGSDAGDAG